MRALTITWLVLLAGCQTAPTPKSHEVIPPPFTAHGATVTISDERHAWEKEQHAVGPAAVYRISRAFPNAWTQLAKETETVVGEMPEKPQRVDVFVTSFRLVRKEDRPSIHDPSDNVKIGRQSVKDLDGTQNKLAYEQLKQANTSGNQKAVNAIGSNLLFADGNPSLAVQGQPAEPEESSDALMQHPAGASCRVRATVRLTYADGREKLLDVQAICAGQNTSGTQYWGEALDLATGQAVRQYGHQLRRELGVAR